MSLRDGLRSELEWTRSQAGAHTPEQRPEKRVATVNLAAADANPSRADWGTAGA
jgi:hypothetical protein